MKNDQAITLLKSYDLRLTPVREIILNQFLTSGYALSHNDIESELDSNLDRVTIYRTLKTFLEKGIIHKILNNDGSLKYALCSELCEGPYDHHHDHVHFKCNQCGQTNCLETAVPTLRLPKGYRVEETNLLLLGICANCSV